MQALLEKFIQQVFIHSDSRGACFWGYVKDRLGYYSVIL